MKILLLLPLFLFAFRFEALADGRDIAATSTCFASETEEAKSLLVNASGWSEARWSAATKLLNCYGGKFKLQKFREKIDDTPSSSVTYRIEILKANLSYEDKVYISLSFDEGGITKNGSGQDTAK